MYNRRSNNGSRTTFSGSRRGGRGGFQRGYGQDDLTSALGRMSVGSTRLKIPPLSAFEFDSLAVAGRAVEIGERVAQAEDIPINYDTSSAYLMVWKTCRLDLSTHKLM